VGRLQKLRVQGRHEDYKYTLASHGLAGGAIEGAMTTSPTPPENGQLHGAPGGPGPKTTRLALSGKCLKGRFSGFEAFLETWRLALDADCEAQPAPVAALEADQRMALSGVPNPDTIANHTS